MCGMLRKWGVRFPVASQLKGDNIYYSRGWDNGRRFILEMEFRLLDRENCYWFGDLNRIFLDVSLPARLITAPIAGAKDKIQVTSQAGSPNVTFVQSASKVLLPSKNSILSKR
jgi:hypothetical protein